MKKSTIILIIIACVMIPIIAIGTRVIISFIAVPNMAGIQERSMVATDIRTAEEIGKSVKLWQMDGVEGERVLPTTPVEYNEIEGLCPEYINASYTAKSLNNGKYYVTSVNIGDSYVICVYIGDEAPSQPDGVPLGPNYNGTKPDWAYLD